MCEGLSSIAGPIPPDTSLFPQYYKRPFSARGRIEGNQDPTLALRSGPVAPDATLYPGYCSARTPPPHPRISPNAAHILERGRRGVVGDLLRLNGVSMTPVPKQKQHVPDFGKENVRCLREIQRRCKEHEAERARARPAPVKALWTSSKYQNTPSRVVAQLQVTNSMVKPECQNFLKAHSHGSSSRQSPKPAPIVLQCRLSCNSMQDKELKNFAHGVPTPRLKTISLHHLQVHGHSVDFIKHNARAAGKTVLFRSKSLTNIQDKPVPSAVKGQVPKYIEERKEQWRKEAEERKRNTPDPSAPPGHTLMPQTERVETLKTMKETHRSLVAEMLSLPLNADTLSIRSRRTQLDCRLSEIEEAIKIFSREKVYIRIDS